MHQLREQQAELRKSIDSLRKLVQASNPPLSSSQQARLAEIDTQASASRTNLIKLQTAIKNGLDPSLVKGSVSALETQIAALEQEAKDVRGSQTLAARVAKVSEALPELSKQVSTLTLAFQKLAGAEAAAPPAVAPATSVDSALPAGGSSLIWSPSIEVRSRGEVHLASYKAAGDDLHGITSRVRAGAAGERGPLKFLVQVQDARRFGSALVGRDDGDTGVHQGYLQATWPSRWLRMGRQEVSYGDQRMIGSLGWAPAARSFDGVRFHQDIGKWQMEVLGTYVRSQRPITFSEMDESGNETTASLRSEGDFLSVGYATFKPTDKHTLDGYLMYRHDGPTESSAQRARDIAALGTRVDLALGKPLRLNGEAIVQAGKNGDENHFAFAMAGSLSYETGVSGVKAVSLGGSYGSGPSKSGTVDEFDNFYPTNHKFYGLADLIGLRNMQEGYLKLKLGSQEKSAFGAGVGAHLLGLAKAHGRWSHAGGGTLGQSSEGNSRSLGTELDATGSWTGFGKVKVNAGYGVFLPASAGKRLGHSETTHFGYLMVGSVFK